MSCIYINKLDKDSFDILLDIKLMDIYPKNFEYEYKIFISVRVYQINI